MHVKVAAPAVIILMGEALARALALHYPRFFAWLRKGARAAARALVFVKARLSTGAESPFLQFLGRRGPGVCSGGL